MWKSLGPGGAAEEFMSLCSGREDSSLCSGSFTAALPQRGRIGVREGRLTLLP